MKLPVRTDRAKWLVAALLIVVLAVPAASAHVTRRERKMLARVNHARVVRDLAPLDRGRRTSRDARAHTRAMIQEASLFHDTFPCSSGWWGQNVGNGPTVRSVFRAFMRSPVHRDKILGRFHRIGVGVIRSDGLVWVTLNFCR